MHSLHCSTVFLPGQTPCPGEGQVCRAGSRGSWAPSLASPMHASSLPADCTLVEPIGPSYIYRSNISSCARKAWKASCDELLGTTPVGATGMTAKLLSERTRGCVLHWEGPIGALPVILAPFGLPVNTSAEAALKACPCPGVSCGTAPVYSVSPSDCPCIQLGSVAICNDAVSVLGTTLRERGLY